MTKYPSKNARLMSSKVLHRPLKTFVILEALQINVKTTYVDLTSELSNLLSKAGQNQTQVPFKQSQNTDDEGLVVVDNCVLYKNKVRLLASGNFVQARFRVVVGLWLLEFFLNNQPYELKEGEYDVLIPYVFSFDNLPVEQIQRVTNYLMDIKPVDLNNVKFESDYVDGLIDPNDAKVVSFSVDLPDSNFTIFYNGIPHQEFIKTSSKSIELPFELKNWESVQLYFERTITIS